MYGFYTDLEYYYCKNPDTQKIVVTIPKFEQHGFTIEKCVQNMQTELQTV